MKGINVCVSLRYSRYSSPKNLIKQASSSVTQLFNGDPGGGCGTLTDDAIVEEPPKEDGKYDETHMVL